MTCGQRRILIPVSDEPVKATTSWGPRWAEQIAHAAHEQRERALGQGPRFDQELHDAMGDEGGAGRRLGDHRHARRAARTAAFSARPQAGKLNALMWTATPWRGTRTCCPWKRGVRPSCTPVAVDEDLGLAQVPAQVGVGREREDGAVDVELGVAAGVAAARDREVEELVAMGGEDVGHGLQQGAPRRRRSWREAPARLGRARRPGPRARSMPVAAAVASGSSVAGFKRVSPGSVPWTQAPPT